MNSNNILTEVDIGTIFKYLFSSKFRRQIRNAKTPQLKKALKRFNAANDELADAYEDAFGKPLQNAGHMKISDLFK